MSKITKNQRINQIADQLARQQGVISKLTIMVKEQNEAILMLEKLTDEKLRDQPEPQLKQLDQSVFDGLDEKWRFAAVDADGSAYAFMREPEIDEDDLCFIDSDITECKRIGDDYDTTDWQDSLIERESVELTGSDLALELLKNQRYIIASVSDVSDADAIECGNNKLIYKSSEDIFTDDMGGIYCWAVALNNQGEPLTASEVGL